MRANPQVLSFNGGEVGEHALARADLEIAPKTAATLENIFIAVQGGMIKAPGTQFLRETPTSARAVLRPFVFSESQSFVMELSANKMRLIQGDGYVSLEGALATIGAWSDQSGAPSTGGGAPPPPPPPGSPSDPIGPGGGYGGGGGGSGGGGNGLEQF